VLFRSLDQGDLEAADEGFERARDFMGANAFSGPGGLGWLARTGTLVAIAAGQVDVARSWSEQVEDSFWGGVCVARVQLLEGRRAEAAAVLDRVAPRCVRHEVIHNLLRARAADTQQQALIFVRRAVERATRSGLVQTVATEGAGVLDLLEVHAWMASKTWLDRLRTAASPHAGRSSGSPSLPGEPLTDREHEVLRMLPSRLTLREIAGELFISLNTLKFHLRVIYRKLGVGSRAEAAGVARRATALNVARRSPI